MNVIGLILISGLLAGGYWFFLYDHGEGIIAETEKLRQEIIKSDHAIIKKKDKLQELVAFDDSVKVMGKEVEAFLEYLPESLNSRILFEDLTRVAQISNISINNVTNTPASKSKEMYETLTVNLILEGQFSNFLTFLSELTKLNKIIVIQSIRLQSAPSTGQNKKSSESRITANVSLKSFRYYDSSALQNEKEDKKS